MALSLAPAGTAAAPARALESGNFHEHHARQLPAERAGEQVAQGPKLPLRCVGEKAAEGFMPALAVAW